MVGSALSFLRISRGGPYNRVAEITWENPLDGLPGVDEGGRWNAPDSFPVVYLNKTVKLARLYVAHKLRDHPYGPEDIDPDTGDVLATVDLPAQDHVDIVTDEGCLAVGLPITYPVDASGGVIRQETCRPIGGEAWRMNERGIACRSATVGAAREDEELAWFQRGSALTADSVLGFTDWFFAADLV